MSQFSTINTEISETDLLAATGAPPGSARTKDTQHHNPDLGIRRILVTQEAHVVPYSVKIVSEEGDRFAGVIYTPGGRSAKHPANPNSERC